MFCMSRHFSFGVTFLSLPLLLRYTALVLSLLKPDGAILMYTYEYNQKERDRQPYSVPEALVRELFGERCMDTRTRTRTRTHTHTHTHTHCNVELYNYSSLFFYVSISVCVRLLLFIEMIQQTFVYMEGC